MAFEKIKEDIVKIFDDKDVKFELIGGTWTGNIHITTKFGVFKFSELPSGCGSNIFSGYGNALMYGSFIPSKLNELFKVMIPVLISRGIGSVITTSGDISIKQTQVLKLIGFKNL